MKRIAIFVFFSLALVILPVLPIGGQTTYNLDIIWQRGTPDTSLYKWGAAIAGVGDVNGDGYDDVAVGAYKAGGEDKDTAKIYVFYGDSSFDTLPDLIISDLCKGVNGLALCGGDINGDGYSDIIICAPSAGKVYIHFGGDPPSQTFDIAFGGRLYETFAIVATGDLNGDDTTDLIVGDFWNMNGNGHVYIYKGSAAFDTMPWIRINGHDYEKLGHELDAGGDVNGDGYNDLVVGANGYNVDERGRVYVFYGGADMDTIPDWWKDGEGPQQYWGEMPSAICADSSGYARVWTGSVYYPGGYGTSQQNGKAELFYGGNPIDSIPDMVIVGADSFSSFGQTFASSYIDSGFRRDLICGAAEPIGAGLGRVWTGKLVQDTVVSGWISGRWERDFLGVNVTNAGDVNGDSREEVMFGSYADTNRLVVICKYTGPEGVEQIAEDRLQITELKLGQNYPNPFNKATVIRYQVTGDEPVKLSVYNIAGQLVKTLIPPNLPLKGRDKGEGSVTWDGRDNNGRVVPNGVYVYKLETSGRSVVHNMTFIK